MVFESAWGGKRVKAADFARHWNVALKTAKRDIAALKEQGIIEFVGLPKTGIYRLMQDLALSIPVKLLDEPRSMSTTVRKMGDVREILKFS